MNKTRKPSEANQSTGLLGFSLRPETRAGWQVSVLVESINLHFAACHVRLIGYGSSPNTATLLGVPT